MTEQRKSESRKRRIAAGALAGVAATLIAVQAQVAEAERANTPQGKFLVVDGVTLHYTDTGGSKPVVVLLHGNESDLQNFMRHGSVA